MIGNTTTALMRFARRAVEELNAVETFSAFCRGVSKL